ncbi:hypothetical protein BVG79_02296 [Ketogulonicigenium robustum]|uniref:Nodulation protein NodH n=1 Tax=Ketogulonicigenium robustum TaxID=92947 RepID=A0A1W6P2D3_9RHOB|nr:nodulation protein NodH [Ketogulonicigenium robustum]ARO15636.1 hypothetical protein BVG79_02296 [Ketogulonicigenium robustum]
MTKFDSFVVFAEMRTGSNFLETNLNTIPGVACLGEAFNPQFIGYPAREDLLGVTYADRVADPMALLKKIRNARGGVLQGFRFFSNHDARVLDKILPDPKVAKVILTRNPIDSYISRKIASATGQWKVTNITNAKREVIGFDAAEFEEHLQAHQAFQVTLMHGLQTTGQTAFYIDYDDLHDLAVLNGLAVFLGVEGRLEALDQKVKKQNPEAVADKVENFPEMEEALARLDRFNLSRTPNFEPRRGPGVPGFVAAARSNLLFLPVASGPVQAVTDWLAALDGAAPEQKFNLGTLRQWKADRPGHRSFTVLRHPLARAHAAFCDNILCADGKGFRQIRNHLARHFAMPMPEGGEGPHTDDILHAAAFSSFLTFVKANLSSQTALRVDGCWASQVATLQGFAQFATPDAVLREDELPEGLALLAAQVGRDDLPELPFPTDPHAARLVRIYSPSLEAQAREAYARDYMAFGFGDWRPSDGV